MTACSVWTPSARPSMVSAANDKEKLVNENLRRVGAYMKENQLRLAPEKAEAVILQEKRKRDVNFRVGNIAIILKASLTYLGVTIGANAPP